MYFQVNEEEFEEEVEDDQEEAKDHHEVRDEGEDQQHLEQNLSCLNEVEDREDLCQDDEAEANNSFVTTSAEASNSQSKKSEADEKTPAGG